PLERLVPAPQPVQGRHLPGVEVDVDVVAGEPGHGGLAVRDGAGRGRVVAELVVRPRAHRPVVADLERLRDLADDLPTAVPDGEGPRVVAVGRPAGCGIVEHTAGEVRHAEAHRDLGGFGSGRFGGLRI